MTAVGSLRAVVLDVDETLVASERHGHRVAFNLAFAHFGLPDRWDDGTYRELLRVSGGRPRLVHWFTRHRVEPRAARALASLVHRRKTEILAEMATSGDIPLRPGVADLVASLHARGTPVHLATTGTREWVEPLLERHFPERPFGVVVTGSDVPELKPHPAAYLQVLARTGVPASAVVSVEDSRNGLVAAHAAGLRCAVTVGDYTDADDVAAADLLVPDATHLRPRDLEALVSAPTTGRS